MMELKKVKVEQVPRVKNSEADNIAKMASLGTTQLPEYVLVEYIPSLSISLNWKKKEDKLQWGKLHRIEGILINTHNEAFGKSGTQNNNISTLCLWVIQQKGLLVSFWERRSNA